MKFRLLSILLLPLVLVGCSTSEPEISQDQPGANIQASLESHVHGLAIDKNDSKNVYVATHDGLFLLKEDQELIPVGKSKDDFMGFSAHPIDPNIFFSSGHPKRGGNLGIQKSTDGGVTWKKLTDGDSYGPVDFHAMTISEANASLLYGWHGGLVYRSEDGGSTWKNFLKQVVITSFAADPSDQNIVYAGTRGGLMKSSNKGESWELVFKLSNPEDIVFDVEADKQSGALWISTVNQGIMRAEKGTLKFETLGTLPNGVPAMQLALDRKNPALLYAASGEELFKSTDGGKSWKKIL